MSTTRPQPAGDGGQEPESFPAAAAPEAAAADGGLEEPPVAGAGAAGTEGGGGTVRNAAEGAAAACGAAQPAGDAGGTSTATTPALRQVRRLRLAGAGGAVARARDFTRQALHDWSWLPAATADQRAAAEDALLVVSELVTNACLHAEGPEELRLGNGAKVLRVEVVDAGSGSPSPRTPHRVGRPGGHGMFIVQRLCLDWGVVRSPQGTGKTVWAELPAPN
ncbi:ATP-binding protein [Streptomyces sulphureus]|uniref:ATP-binding protein n=1 Tax=Streptomyces sulphureus TaxID=47758 RepID=UPI000374EB91